MEITEKKTKEDRDRGKSKYETENNGNMRV